MFEAIERAAQFANEFTSATVSEGVTRRRQHVDVFVEVAVQEGEVDVDSVKVAAKSGSESEEKTNGDAIRDGRVGLGFVVVNAVLLMAPPYTKAGLEATIGLLADDNAGREGLATMRKFDWDGEDVRVDDTVHFVVVRLLGSFETVLRSEGLEVFVAASPVRCEVLGHWRRMLGLVDSGADKSGGLGCRSCSDGVGVSGRRSIGSEVGR